LSAVGTTQPYPANSLAGGLVGWAAGRVGWARAAQGGLAGPGLGGATQIAKGKSPSAVGTVHIFKPFFNLLTFLIQWLTPIPKFIVRQFCG
jgi:hypothetical protein